MCVPGSTLCFTAVVGQHADWSFKVCTADPSPVVDVWLQNLCLHAAVYSCISGDMLESLMRTIRSLRQQKCSQTERNYIPKSGDISLNEDWLSLWLSALCFLYLALRNRILGMSWGSFVKKHDEWKWIFHEILCSWLNHIFCCDFQ